MVRQPPGTFFEGDRGREFAHWTGTSRTAIVFYSAEGYHMEDFAAATATTATDVNNFQRPLRKHTRTTTYHQLRSSVGHSDNIACDQRLAMSQHAFHTQLRDASPADRLRSTLGVLALESAVLALGVIGRLARSNEELLRLAHSNEELLQHVAQKQNKIRLA